MLEINQRIAQDISAKAHQVEAAIRLLDEGATVPFVARYRKEVTGGLDDSQLRLLEERLRYLRTLEQRREMIIGRVDELGKLTPELAAKLKSAETKTELEDLYLPYKSRRKTRADQAREAGLEPLADQLLQQKSDDFPAVATGFINKEAGYETSEQVLDGAAEIIMQRFSEDAALIGPIRDKLWHAGHIESKVKKGKEQSGQKFSDYFEHDEKIKSMPSHRTLALFRARSEGVIDLKLVIPDTPADVEHPCVQKICNRYNLNQSDNDLCRWLRQQALAAWQKKISPHLSLDLFGRIREQAETEAIRVFRDNIKDILLAAPAGPRPTLGLDPGLRTGVKVAVIGVQGEVLETGTIYPHAPKKQWGESIAELKGVCAKHQVELVSVGNGTGSRETEQLVAELNKKHPELKLTRVTVSEAGASVYSASAVAAREFPDLDVSIRGAISIARRLQDPMAELVKIDPRSIGVGQYQHDVNQQKLAQALDGCVEDCVNAVGVDLNLASEHLLARVAGLGQSSAAQIVQFREQNGPFGNRQSLNEVPRLGPKTFEQCAGFLRIRNGDEPLDSSGVHPEAYPLVGRILGALGKPLDQVLGKGAVDKGFDPSPLVDDRFGLPTIKDVIQELEKPGRDPRAKFRSARFQEGVDKISDLETGMVLEGVVTNVTNFGAFVDVGVHQDGLVHISSMANKFVDDPRKVVKAGDIVRVKVTGVDADRKRISLSMRLEEKAPGKPAKRKAGPPNKTARSHQRPPARPKSNSKPSGAMAEAFARAKRK